MSDHHYITTQMVFNFDCVSKNKLFNYYYVNGGKYWIACFIPGRNVVFINRVM